MSDCNKQVQSNIYLNISLLLASLRPSKLNNGLNRVHLCICLQVHMGNGVQFCSFSEPQIQHITQTEDKSIQIWKLK